MMPLETKTSHLRPSLNQQNVVQEPESDYSSRPPSYRANDPCESSFGNGVAVYPNRNGMQTELEATTATSMTLRPAAMTTTVDPLPLIPTAGPGPSNIKMVLDEGLLRPPPHLARPHGLRRGLQVPSRISVISWGFSFPRILAEHGVTETQWKLFTHELKRFARMHISQLLALLACEAVFGYLFAPVGPFIGRYVAHKVKKHKEHRNFTKAYRCGAMRMFENRWNKNYFQPLGLQIRVEPPWYDFCDISTMDVASSKWHWEEKRYWYRESDYRGEALRKGRIIILPFNTVNHVYPQLRRTASEGNNGQSVVRATAKLRPSFQDFASLNQTQTGTEDLKHDPVLAQHLTQSRQRQSDSEDLYGGRSEDNAERAPSLARAPTTHWGGNR